MNGQKSTSFTKRKNKKNKKVASDSSSSCSNNCSSSSRNGIRVFRNPKRIRVGSITTRKSVTPGEVDALALPLGMSIAAVVSKVLERENSAGEKMSMDYLSGIGILAVRESISSVFGDKFDSFVENFETSFRSTLMTLRLFSESSRNVEELLQRATFRERSCEEVENSSCPNSNDGSISSPSRNKNIRRFYSHETIEENPNIDLINRQLVVREGEMSHQLSRAYDNSSSSMLSTIEKSVIEQTRSNDLKSFEIGLIMKKMELKERQLSLNSDSNILERWKLSMGFSRASFKAEKFKTQLQDTRQVELLKTCLDFLVSGLIIMLLSLGYGTYVYSHRRIAEVTEACSPAMNSKSWWMPKQMSAFNSGLQIFLCQIQVLSRMLFGGIVIGAIAFLLVQRSSTSHQTMPITFILLLLGVACGFAGKFCIDTLGGSGYRWLIYWETLCLLHFFSNIFHSTLYVILNGPICVVEKVERNKINLYWIRRSLFYSTLIFLPLLCGFVPFASVSEWVAHFSSMAVDFITVVED